MIIFYFQELKNKLANLEKIRSRMVLNDPDYESLVKGTPTRPELNVLMKYATQAYLHHTNVYPFEFLKLLKKVLITN